MTKLGHFLETFAVPFVRGGEVLIGKPISYADSQQFNDDIPHETLYTEQIDSARKQVLSEILVKPPIMLLGPADISLLCAVYNALLAIHPDAESWPSSSFRERLLRHAQRQCHVQSEWNMTRHLGRYALMHNLFAISRVDIDLSWWTGKAKYFGQQPPSRLLRWQGIRRVHLQEKRVAAQGLLAKPGVASVIESILNQVPLLPLFQPGVGQLDWSRAHEALLSSELARAAVNQVFTSSPWSQNTIVVYTSALIDLLEQHPPRTLLETVLSFFVYLNGAIAQEECRLGYGEDLGLLSRIGGDNKLDNLAPFFALPNAMAVLEPKLSIPPGVEEDDALRRRWSLHRRFISQSDPGSVDFWVSLLGRFFPKSDARAVG